MWEREGEVYNVARQTEYGESHIYFLLLEHRLQANSKVCARQCLCVCDNGVLRHGSVRASCLDEFPSLDTLYRSIVSASVCVFVCVCVAHICRLSSQWVSSSVRGEQDEPEEEALLQAGLELQYGELYTHTHTHAPVML